MINSKQTLNIELLIKLGEELKSGVPNNLYDQAISDNHIFSKDSIDFAINAITSELLDKDKIMAWVDSYPNVDIKGCRIAVIMAGNIPLVGISDLISIIICNGVPLIKPSSKDKALMIWVMKILKGYDIKIELLDDNSTPDAVIATGSNMSNTVFKQKYGQLPLLIRGSRTSVAVISEMPSDEQIHSLWVDMFQHSSLGCRNISHLLINSKIDIAIIADKLSAMPLNNSYIENNYKQKRAIMEMTGMPYIECGYFLLRESTSMEATIGEVTYNYYNTKSELNEFLQLHHNSIQCIVGDSYIPYGNAQRPTLYDWADGIDTIKFLMGCINRTR